MYKEKKLKKYKVTQYTIKSTKLCKNKATRMVVLSDFHNNSYGLNQEDVLKKIIELAPDYVLIAGDMCTGSPGCDNENATWLLRRIAEKYEVYYGLGNHEYRMMIYPDRYPGMYDAFKKMADESGIHLLMNEKVEISRGSSTIRIYGLMIDRSFYKKFKITAMSSDYVGKLLGEPDENLYNILIAHHPSYFPQYAEWGADLVVSGHVHGGMARLPLLGGIIAPNYRLFPKYDKGMFYEDDAVMILSAGIGTHTINLRPFNPPEIVVVDLV